MPTQQQDTTVQPSGDGTAPFSVSMVGLGYIGLPTAVLLANSGIPVTGIDTNEATVEAINSERVRHFEPGLQEALHEAISNGNLRARTDYVHTDVYIIAVPTPANADHSVDVSFIDAAADAIAPHLEGNELIILESTSPPLTTRRVADRITAARPDLIADSPDAQTNSDLPRVYFAHCPERILPGSALTELVTNDRIIGGATPEATRRATAVYATFCEGELLPTNDVTAEMAKLTENSFRDVNIAFANELSLIADTLDINVWELIELANHHPRVNILQPGPGVGGHCIAVDPWFIVSTDPANSRLIRTAREVNDHKPVWVRDQIGATIARVQERPATTQVSVALLGLAFKANIDDLRESPSLAIATESARTFPQVSFLAVEPNIDELPEQLAELPNVKQSDLDTALREAQVIVLLVDHREFTAVPATALKGKQIVDTKGIWV